MKKLVITIAIIGWSYSVFAAPSISGVSGTVSEGSSITISGSGFGSKSIASPMLWGDFESGSSGASITSSGPNVYAGGLSSYSSWQKSGANSLTINTSSPLNRSTKHARVSFTSGSVWYTFVSIPYTFSTEGQKLYFSYNYRYNVTSTWPRQTKAFIWYDSSYGDKMYMSTAFENCEPGGWRMHVTQDGETYLSSAGRSLNNEWVRLENYMIQSGVNTNNGSWASAIIRASSIDANTRSSCFRTDSKSWVELALGGAYYSMCGTDPATLDIDNIYIDNTPQRVEIGNASTWTACTYREIQIPTAWTTTSLSVTVRRGNFGATDGAYLYVVDDSGSANSTGYPITFATQTFRASGGVSLSGGASF